MLTPTLFYVFITSMIGAMQFFTAALFIQTPREAGTFLNVYIWQQAFGSQKMGYASALAWILLAITFALTAAGLSLVSRCGSITKARFARRSRKLRESVGFLGACAQPRRPVVPKAAYKEGTKWLPL